MHEYRCAFGSAFLAMALIAASFASSPQVRAAVYDCEMDGEHVNPANGSTTRGRTGIMKCVDRDTRKLVREEEYRNGRAVGHRKFVDYRGNVSVWSVNEQGNREGEARRYDAEGNLLAEERYANGNATGLQVYYYASGNVQRRVYHEPGKGRRASIEYTDRGELMRLDCADEPLLGDDRELCGFNGRVSEVTFHDAKGQVAGRARFENGKRLAMTALGAGGAVARSEEEAHGGRRVVRVHFPDGALRMETVVAGKLRESERELAQSGQRLRETRWHDGWKAEETLWYLNGQPKSKTRWEREGKEMRVISETYWDNGRMRERSTRDNRGNYIGVVERYTEKGELESEATYRMGKLTRRRSYKDGKLEVDEELFEDGSRKSVRRAQ